MQYVYAVYLKNEGNYRDKWISVILVVELIILFI
jgi:hypothetical protein